MADLLDQAALLAQAERFVQAALRAGADAADAVVERDVALSVALREGALESSESAQSDLVGLRVFVGRRSAILSSNDPRESADALAERAVAFARLAPENPFAGLADSSLLARGFPALDLLDPVLADVAALEKRALAAEVAMLASSGIKSGGVSASSSLQGFALVTSHGFSGSLLTSGHSVSAMAISGEGTGMERDYDYDAKVFASDLDDPAAIGRKAAERALRRLGPRKVETCRVPVIYEARAASSLVGHLSAAINGASVARKTSFLREKMGAQLFKPGITIVDDPLRPRGPASRPFDGEGVAQKRRSLIEDGRLTTWLLDVASANELGLISTGHAARSAASPPSPSASNLHLEAGKTSLADMIRSVGTGLYVTDMIGHGVNPVTGDYSRGCSGFWIDKGELAFPVSEVTIAGNLVDMFAQMTPADDLVFRHGTNAPSVMVEGLTLAGL